MNAESRTGPNLHNLLHGVTLASDRPFEYSAAELCRLAEKDFSALSL